MSLENDIFRQAKLTPTAPKVRTGYCRCDPRTETDLYKTGTRLQCDVCTALNQAYPHEKGMMRLTDGSCLLITPSQITFWGACKLDQINPDIIVRSATGEMVKVQINLILHPPPTPWMVFVFAKANVAEAIRVTEDNRRLRLGGKMQIRRRVITDINRDHVMQMFDIGMTAKEWDGYMSDYAQDKRVVTDKLQQKYPRLLDLRKAGLIPAMDSPEHLALTYILMERKPAHAKIV